MAGGYSNREIGEALGTSEGTVKNHASTILSKLGAAPRDAQAHEVAAQAAGHFGHSFSVTTSSGSAGSSWTEVNCVSGSKVLPQREDQRLVDAPARAEGRAAGPSWRCS